MQAEALREIGEQVKERKFDGIHAVAPIHTFHSNGGVIPAGTLLGAVKAATATTTFFQDES